MATHDAFDRASPAAAETAIRRFAFLATAGEVLAASVDLGQTLQELARLAVPTLGDLCIVDLVEEGLLRRVATEHANPVKVALMDELRRDYPPSPESPQPAGRVMRTGEYELLETVSADVLAAHTCDRRHEELIRAIDIQSHLAVPLVARGTTLGVISVGISESRRRYGPEDVALAHDLARLAALAIDNARLYQLAQQELAERRRAEEAERLSESRFRAIFEQSPLSTQILAPSGETMRVNRAWENLWGFRLEQLAGYNMLADPQLEAQGTAPLLRRAFQGEAVHLPTICYDPNATVPEGGRYADATRWVSAFAYPVKDVAGAVREVVLVHQDITEARQHTEKLQASEERLRLALSVGRMNVWDWDLSTDLVECSDNARAFWGVDIGHAADFMAVIHPEDVPSVKAAGRSAIAGAGDYVSEYRLIRPDGLRWVQSRGRVDRNPEGRALRILGVTLDITDLKLAEEATRLTADAGSILGSSLDYQTTLRHLSNLLVPRFADWCAVDLVTESGTLERVSVSHSNPARVALACELFVRFPPRRSSGQGAWNVIDTGKPEWAADISEAMLQAMAYGPEHLALLKELNLRSHICVPLIARGATIGALTLVHAERGRRYSQADVSVAEDLGRRAGAAVDNAQLYQQLRTEDRRKDEFLATLAHELRNPLAPLRTGLALLRASTDPEVAERTRQVMDRQLGHMVRLIDDLLDLSRVTRGTVQLEVERADLWAVVGSAIESSRPLIDAAGVQLAVRLPEAPVLLDVDRTRMSQVLSNLLNNAAKYTEPGGRVELEAVEDPADIVIRVSDTGMGIPRQMLTQIFELFAQVGDNRSRSQSGLGIGLTLVRRLVELHGGRVWAESEGEGRGSTFVIRLPRADGVGGQVGLARGLSGAARPHDARSSGQRVLVVDDNTDAAEMLAALLSLHGHDVRTASNGPTALEMAREFHPQIAFLDIGLPGMSGYELARRMRSEPDLAALILVAVTGWGQDEDRRRSADAGFDRHVTKPVDSAEILALANGAGSEPTG